MRTNRKYRSIDPEINMTMDHNRTLEEAVSPNCGKHWSVGSHPVAWPRRLVYMILRKAFVWTCKFPWAYFRSFTVVFTIFYKLKKSITQYNSQYYIINVTFWWVNLLLYWKGTPREGCKGLGKVLYLICKNKESESWPSWFCSSIELIKLSRK